MVTQNNTAQNSRGEAERYWPQLEHHRLHGQRHDGVQTLRCCSKRGGGRGGGGGGGGGRGSVAATSYMVAEGSTGCLINQVAK